MATKETKEMSASRSVDSFAGTGLDQMQCWLSVSLEKFDLEKFRGELGPKAKERDAYGTLVAPKDPKNGDYHVRANWHVEKDEIVFLIEYLVGPKAHEKDEHEPYAEQFMEWVGHFFKHETAQAHIHARFEYPLEARRSKFPLPLKTALEGDAEIDGISLRLPAKPKGVSRVRLTQGKTHWYVEVIANRRFTFKGYSPYDDVQAFMSVLDTLIEEKRS